MTSHSQDQTRAQGQTQEAAARADVPAAWTELIVPGLAVAIVISVLVPQVMGGLARSTVVYGFLVGLPVVALALPIFVQAVRRNLQRTDGLRWDLVASTGAIKVWLCCLVTAALVLSLDTVGYGIGFTAYLLVMARLLHPGSWAARLLVTAVTVAIIHFLFVVQFELSLPKRLLEGLL